MIITKYSKSYGKCEIIIDDTDLILLKDYSLVLSESDNRVYVRLYKNKKYIYLHRFLLNVKKGQYVDHINRNTLDNRKENIRICTNQENSFNMKRPKTQKSTSKYKGVIFGPKYNKTNPWIASIKFKYKKLHIGYFKTELEAAKAYDKKALELFGNFALLNEV